MPSALVVVPLAAPDSQLTFDELLALIVALPDFDFIDWLYSPDSPDWKWSTTAFFGGERDGSVDGYGDTKEEAMFLLFISAISGGVRHFHD